MKKIKRVRTMLQILLFVILSLTLSTRSAMAAENKSLEIYVTVMTQEVLPEKPGQASLILLADNLDQPMPQESVQGKFTLNIPGSGTYKFPKITYDKVGTYQYTIWQQKGSDPDRKYDPTIYKLKVMISNAQAGGLDITTTVYKENNLEKSPEIIFLNSYAAPARIKFKAFKTMDGGTPKGDRFTFQLTNAAGKLLQSKMNMGKIVEFDEVIISQTGTRVFMIREKKGSNRNILYDESVYLAKVLVQKNIQGDYEASVSYEKYGKPFMGVPIFANKTTKELPYTGTKQSALPIAGTVLVLCGIAMAIIRKKI